MISESVVEVLVQVHFLPEWNCLFDIYQRPALSHQNRRRDFKSWDLFATKFWKNHVLALCVLRPKCWNHAWVMLHLLTVMNGLWDVGQNPLLWPLPPTEIRFVIFMIYLVGWLSHAKLFIISTSPTRWSLYRLLHWLFVCKQNIEIIFFFWKLFWASKCPHTQIPQEALS